MRQRGRRGFRRLRAQITRQRAPRHDVGKTINVLAGVFASLASVSRYDGWAAVRIETVAVVIVATARYRARRSVEGLSVLFGVLAFSGIAGWLLWNQLIFSDPLYFAQSVYGSAEQQQFFLRTGLLPTYHDVGKSVHLRAAIGQGMAW